MVVRSADGGELVDVGGHKLFISCRGTGSPTVVLEGGLGQGSDYFALIAPKVATTTRVCAYDRAGHGRSEPATGTQDGTAIARDLHSLLAASGNPGPYILAGHSSGGVYVRFFAAAYPGDVAGVVLLDAQSPHATPVQSAAPVLREPGQHPHGDAAGPRSSRDRPTRCSRPGRATCPPTSSPPARRRSHPAGSRRASVRSSRSSMASSMRRAPSRTWATGPLSW